MIIGDRLRLLRETKKLSQGDIEKRTGLLRCYISRVENGHTVPAIETLEKLARALEVPLYQLFYDGEEPPELPNLPKRKTADDIAWGSSGKEARFLAASADCWDASTKATGASCCTWRRRWPIARAVAAIRSVSRNSLPLDRARRFRADVVDDPVHSSDFVYDSDGNSFEHFPGQPHPVRGHGVF